MKRVLFLCIAYFLCLSFVYGKVNIGAQITDPLELKAGDRITIRSVKPLYTDENKQFYRFLGSIGDSLVWRVLSEPETHPTIAFVLESAGGLYDGFPYYYLKNEITGKYLVYNSDQTNVSSYRRCTLAYTDNKKNASPFVFYFGTVPDYSGDSVTWVVHISLLTRLKENLDSRSFLSLDLGDTIPFLSSNNTDWEIHVYRLTTEVDYVEDLKFLYEQVSELNFVSGSNLGEYDGNLVKDFNDCRDEAKALLAQENPDSQECERLYNALKTAWDDLLVSGPKQFTSGYYRIVSAFSNFKERQGVEKAMYATNNGEVKWKNYDQEDPTMGWEFIKHPDGSWRIKNLGTQQYISSAGGKSSKYVADYDSVGSIIKITPLESGEFNIFLDKSEAMHTDGHNDGNGYNGDIVAWNGGSSTGSAWYIRPLGADTARTFIDYGICEKAKTELNLLINEAKEKYNCGWQAKIDTLPEHWLVTMDDYKADSMVVFSNADHNTLNPDDLDGQGYAGLLDADTVMGVNGKGESERTFWHSNWRSAIVDGQPYLQFKLNKAVDCFAVYLRKRKNQGNQATELSFYVTNDTTSGIWDYAGSITGLPATTSYWDDDKSLTYQSNAFNLGAKYQYVRVFWNSQAGFTHFAGFHFQNAEIMANSLIYREDIKKQAEALHAALLEGMNVLNNNASTLNDVLFAHIQLQKAFGEYVDVYPDISPLKDYLQKVKDYYTMSVSEKTPTETAEIYPDPGTYRESDRQQFQDKIDFVENCIQNMEVDNSYSELDLDLLLRELKESFHAFRSKQRWIEAATGDDPGVWYHIAASQRYYDITGEKQNTYLNYVRRGMIYAKPSDGVMNNSLLYYGTKDDMARNGVTDLDYATWRFIQVNDSAYAIQNKATGMFISTQGSSAVLSLCPESFTLSEIGYGCFILDGYDTNGLYSYPLHAQTSLQRVVYWNTRILGTGSCWDIYTTDRTEKGVSVGDHEFNTISYDRVRLGKLLSYSFPVGLQSITDDSSLGNAVYEVTKIDTLGVVLSPKENCSVKAGEPFFYLPGNDIYRVSDKDSVILKIQVAPGMNLSVPQTANGLTACYDSIAIPENAYVLSDGLPLSFTNEYGGDVYTHRNFAYLVPNTVVSGDVTKNSIVIPFANMSLSGSDRLLSELNQSAVYLYCLGDQVGQYIDTVQFAETYAKALQVWSGLTDHTGYVDMAVSLRSVRQSLRLNLPQTGKSYRIKNHESGLYLVSDVDDYYLIFSDSPSIESSTFFYGNDRHLTGSKKNLQLKGANYGNSMGIPYQFQEVKGKPGLMQILFSENSCLAGSGYYLSETSYTTEDDEWYVEDISDTYSPTFDIELQEYEGEGYATLYLPVAVKLPDGMEAYVGRVEGDLLKMSRLEGDVVPPAVPVVIKGMPGEYHLPYDSCTVNGILTQNDLQGSFVEKSVSEDMNAYTLQIVNGKLGFFKYSGSMLHAFKSFLNLPVNMQVRGIVWPESEITTGCVNEVITSQNAEIYDLSGRRIQEVKQAGVYIVNGKKVVIK